MSSPSSNFACYEPVLLCRILEGLIISSCSLLYCQRTWLTSPFLSIVFTCPFFAVLYLWLSIVMLGQMLQLPLRLLLLFRVRFAHNGQPERGELVRRLIAVIHSRLWRMNHTVGKANFSLLVIGTFLICFRGDQTENYGFEDTLGIETLLASVFRLHPQHIELLLRSPPTHEQMSAIFSCSVAALTTLFLRLASSFALFAVMFRQRGVPMEAERGPSGEKRPSSKFLEDKLKYWKWGENKTREKKEKLLEQKRKLQAAFEQASEELKSKIKPVIDPVMRPLDRLQTTLKDSFHFATSTSTFSMAAIAERHHTHLHHRFQREKQCKSASTIPIPKFIGDAVDPFVDFGFGPVSPEVPETSSSVEFGCEEIIVPTKRSSIGNNVAPVICGNRRIDSPSNAWHSASSVIDSSHSSQNDEIINTDTDTDMVAKALAPTIPHVDLATVLERNKCLGLIALNAAFVLSGSKPSDGTSTPLSLSGSITPHAAGSTGSEGSGITDERTQRHDPAPSPSSEPEEAAVELMAANELHGGSDDAIDCLPETPMSALQPLDGEQVFANPSPTKESAALEIAASECGASQCEECGLDEDIEEEDVDCPICLGPFEMGETVACLPCNNRHFFHASCIHPWLLQDKRCPLCSTDIDWKD